jgi:hypothetical protein
MSGPNGVRMRLMSLLLLVIGNVNEHYTLLLYARGLRHDLLPVNQAAPGKALGIAVGVLRFP